MATKFDTKQAITPHI